jgi:hypothetical protein
MEGGKDKFLDSPNVLGYLSFMNEWSFITQLLKADDSRPKVKKEP